MLLEGEHMTHYDMRKDANQLSNLKIVKRNGKIMPFEPIKIRKAIEAANDECTYGRDRLDDDAIDRIVSAVIREASRASHHLSVEEIQDLVLRGIFEERKEEVYKLYHDYRKASQEARELDKALLDITEVGINHDGSVSGKNEEVNEENSNKNPTVVSVQRDYLAGEVSRDITNRKLIPEDIRIAHEQGVIHFHDTDYFVQHMHNCDLINLEDMLQNGTVISGTMIEKPKSFLVACNVTTQIIAQVASCQYGGQSFSLTHLAPFVQVSRLKYRKYYMNKFEALGIKAEEDKINALAEERVLKEIEDGMQLIQYQLITLQTTNGQAPFVTVFMYINEIPEGQVRDDLVTMIKIMLNQRIKGVKDESGNYITPAFPKLIYVLQENNISEGSRYYDVTKLAAKCTAKRMVPDYISEKIMKGLKGDVYTPMGCRSFLTPDRFTKAGIGNIENRGNYHEGELRYYGRFNQGVVTLNLVDVALSSRGDEEKFWKILSEREELCHKALRIRHERLLGTPSDVAPILWQHGALARLKKGETIDKLLYNGYSTISLGYAGLYECVYYMKHVSHTTDEGREFAMRVMQSLNDACNTWKKAENIDYSVYGTPLESTTYKFAKQLKARFGVIEGVTDHDYITNSYHINVREKISAFDKLSKEAEFQKLSPGGAISYVETPNMENNLDALISIIQYMYDTILYAEVNTKLDLCEKCGYTGNIKIVRDPNKNKLVWECPNCGNRNQDLMHVARRTCGYIGTQFFNQGRTEEIAQRVEHLALNMLEPSA